MVNKKASMEVPGKAKINEHNLSLQDKASKAETGKVEVNKTTIALNKVKITDNYYIEVNVLSNMIHYNRAVISGLKNNNIGLHALSPLDMESKSPQQQEPETDAIRVQTAYIYHRYDDLEKNTWTRAIQKDANMH